MPISSKIGLDKWMKGRSQLGCKDYAFGKSRLTKAQE